MPLREERLAHSAFFPRRFVWGELLFAGIPVAADRVHGVVLDTARQVSYCSCAFQPKPCVHVRALMLLFAREGLAAFETAAALPDWVLALQRGEARQMPAPGPDSGERAAEQAHRHYERLERASHGFEDLETWLLDTLRRGVATAVSEDPDFYKGIAGRLADASMRGLSRNLRLLETIPSSQPDWAEHTLAVLADAALALHAFRGRDRLPEALVHDLESFIGIALRKETVRSEGSPLHDQWAVVGSVEELVEDKLRQRRSWLLGAQSERYALLLEYTHGDQDFLPGFTPGVILEGELIFYPSAWPLRALASGELHTLPQQVEALPGFDHIDAMAHAYAIALGAQPWLPQFPVVLSNVVPCRHKTGFDLNDSRGKSLPLANGAAVGWPLIALSGGSPLTVFGEWDGKTLHILSALNEHRFVSF